MESGIIYKASGWFSRDLFGFLIALVGILKILGGCYGSGGFLTVLVGFLWILNGFLWILLVLLFLFVFL